MPDIRVTVDSDLHFDLRVLALDKQTTLRELVISILTQYRNDTARTPISETKPRPHGTDALAVLAAPIERQRTRKQKEPAQ